MPKVSELKVLRSAAGYYIGTTEFDDEMGCEVPYSRESACYWSVKQDAERALANNDYPTC